MTQRNLYSPPHATTADIRQTSPRPPRPISAWLLEAMLLFFALATLAGLWRTVWMVALEWQRVRSPLGVFLALTGQAALFVTLALSIRGIHRGRTWARWLGLALIAAFTVFDLVRPDRSTYPNEAQRAGAELARYILIPMLCVWWAWAFAFSGKATRFFAPPAAKEAATTGGA